MALEAEYLTSSDVARRLGVSPGTVRHYGEVLRSLGFPMPKGEAPGGEEAYFWPPELVEIARVAYQMARAAKPRLSFEEAVKLILYAAEVAVPAREGSTIPVLLEGVHELQRDLRDLVAELRGLPRSVRDTLAVSVHQARDEAVRAVNYVAHGLSEEAFRLREQAERLVDLVRQAQAGGWVPVAALLVLFFSLVLEPFVRGGLQAVLPYFAVLALGVFMGWWASR